MPELAEVEFYRKQWDCGLRQKVKHVAVHAEKRLFRGTEIAAFAAAAPGATLLGSEARAKQMLFRFSKELWLGVHLGMTGKLRVEPSDFVPEKHDHLAIFQARQTLVLSDARMFGRVLFYTGAEPPEWWTALPPAVASPEFTLEVMRAFLRRRARLAVKAALLVQSAFPGVGNWMADEILWRARIDPRRLCASLSKPRIEALWREAREVCAVAMSTVAIDFSDPPADWLYHARWSPAGKCPRDGVKLKTAQVGGRTTRWCGKCQR
ncbi:MAG TPA: DNA-formamidopyrimidine glycosylase family protein [Chthoniobacteraceae bacterium]|jgi:formamidopyrimidine-DNA glycosylase